MLTHQPVGKRIPPATLIDAPFLQQHFPNAPESVRAEWLTAIQRQAVYSLGDLEFISEQTWKDIGLPGLTRDKLQVLSGWRQPRHQQASAVSPRRSHAPATSSKDRSSDAAHRSPQRTNKSTQKHSDDRDRSRHSPQRHARDVGDGAKSRERDRGREHHAEKGHSNSPSSASGAKHASHSASSAADAHHSRPAKSTSPQRSPRGEPRAESRSHSKHSGGSGGSGSRDKKQAPPTSASAPALPLVPPSLGTPPPPPPKDDEVPDWSDSSSSGDEAPKPPAAPDITLLDVVVPASAKPSASGTAVASAARPVDPAKPKVRNFEIDTPRLVVQGVHARTRTRLRIHTHAHAHAPTPTHTHMHSAYCIHTSPCTRRVAHTRSLSLACRALWTVPPRR